MTAALRCYAEPCKMKQLTFNMEGLPVQLTSDWVVTSQLNSAKEAAQELTVKVAGVSKARQLRGWIYLAASTLPSIRNGFPGGARELQPEH